MTDRPFGPGNALAYGSLASLAHPVPPVNAPADFDAQVRAVEVAITDLFRLASSRRLHQARQERAGIRLSRDRLGVPAPGRRPGADPGLAAGRADGPEPAGHQPGAAAAGGRGAGGPPARSGRRPGRLLRGHAGRAPDPGRHPGGDARRADAVLAGWSGRRPQGAGRGPAPPGGRHARRLGRARAVGQGATDPQSAKPDGSWRPIVPCSNSPQPSAPASVPRPTWSMTPNGIRPTISGSVRS